MWPAHRGHGLKESESKVYLPINFLLRHLKLEQFDSFINQKEKILMVSDKESQKKKHDLARQETSKYLNQNNKKKPPCQICGEVYVEVHHVDYENPYLVVFACATHHRKIHRGLTEPPKPIDIRNLPSIEEHKKAWLEQYDYKWWHISFDIFLCFLMIFTIPQMAYRMGAKIYLLLLAIFNVVGNRYLCFEWQVHRKKGHKVKSIIFLSIHIIYSSFFITICGFAIAFEFFKAMSTFFKEVIPYYHF